MLNEDDNPFPIKEEVEVNDPPPFKACEAVKAYEALKAGFVLVNIDPVTYEAVPANTEALEPVQELGTKLPPTLPPPIALEAV